MISLAERIFVSWRRADSERRYLVGEIMRNDNQVTFQYAYEIYEALRDGMYLYNEFQNIEKKYSTNVLNIFAQRLTPKSRFKTASVYKFWQITQDIVKDDLATIALTQALLPTDNFEFLADFLPKKGLSFITDLSFTSQIALPANLLDSTDHLLWEKRDSDQGQDIVVIHDGTIIGQIKQGHANVFDKYVGNIRIGLHEVEKSFAHNVEKEKRIINKVFVKVQLY